MIAEADTLIVAVIAGGYVGLLTLTVGGVWHRRKQRSRAPLDGAASMRRLREELARHG